MVGGDQERGQFLHARRHGLRRVLRSRPGAVGSRDAGLGAEQRRFAVHEHRLPHHRGRAAAEKPQAFRHRQSGLPDRRDHADGQPGRRRLHHDGPWRRLPACRHHRQPRRS